MQTCDCENSHARLYKFDPYKIFAEIKELLEVSDKMDKPKFANK